VLFLLLLISLSICIPLVITSDIRALTSLNLAKNRLFAEGTKLLAEVLKGNAIMTELNISSNEMTRGGMSGVGALADAIPDMRALSKFDISSNGLRAEGGKALAAGIKGNQVITELNISSNVMGYNFNADFDTSGIIAIADAIPDMGALTSLHVGMNNIPKKEMREMMAIAMCMDNMKILCEVPFKDKALTELDISRKNLGMEGALVVAEYLNGNRAMMCADDEYYHEWSLNSECPPKCRAGHNAVQVWTLQAVASEYKMSKQDVQNQCTCSECEMEMAAERWPLYSCSQCHQRAEWGLCSPCFNKNKKFISTAPDIEGQDKDPGVPLANGYCQRCGQPKDQHKARCAHGCCFTL
jgi:hypothetical protein